MVSRHLGLLYEIVVILAHKIADSPRNKTTARK